MRNNKLRFMTILLLSLSLGLSACGGSTPTFAPPATNPPVATATVAPTATNVPAPTNAPRTTIPTATTAPRPTATPSAKPGLGGRIVYENNNKEIMLINPDGSGRIKVTNGQSPIFAPDGKRLAFVIRAEDFETNPNAKDIMYTVNLDGSGRQEMCSGQNRQYLILSRWSPRDRFIAFGSVPRQTDGFPLIFLCNTTDKKANAGVKPSQGYASVFYDWTPDGENALWHVYETNSWGIYYGDPDKNGAGAVRLASLDDLPVGLPTPEYTSARFSPDGKTVAIMTYNGKLSFVSVPGQKSPLEGKVIDKLSERYSGSLAWSPDGKAIAFYEAKNNALRIIDVADQFGKVTTLATDVGGSLDWSRN